MDAAAAVEGDDRKRKEPPSPSTDGKSDDTKGRVEDECWYCLETALEPYTSDCARAHAVCCDCVVRLANKAAAAHDDAATLRFACGVCNKTGVWRPNDALRREMAARYPAAAAERASLIEATLSPNDKATRVSERHANVFGPIEILQQQDMCDASAHSLLCFIDDFLGWLTRNKRDAVTGKTFVAFVAALEDEWTCDNVSLWFAPASTLLFSLPAASVFCCVRVGAGEVVASASQRKPLAPISFRHRALVAL